MGKQNIKQLNSTAGGKKKATLYFTPTFLSDLKKVSEAQQIGMSSYIEQNLSQKITDDLKKLDNK